MKEAAEFAESTQILMNVSEFTDVSQATDTLISAVQAFEYTAETSMDVVDLLNTIGNNYAISTADLAKSLTKSSASLVAAGGNLAEAAALTATANAIIQDADSVGTALKTTSLRLRGTSVKVLEEEGLDTDGAVESTSKLRSQVLATSGVDILTDTGAYKSTYQILLEIAEVWDQITDDKARAGLLELLAGKRNSSVIAALLQNPEDLKAAYEDAQNAEGSALKENERYLNSIQGRIDQFNNAMQAMWSNALDSDVVKWFVNLGTELIKIVDTIGLIPSILVSILAYKIAVGAVKMFDLTSLGTYISLLFTANSATEVQGLLINKNALAQKLLTSTLIQAQAARMGLTAADLAGYSVTQLLTLGVKGLAAGFKNLWIAMGPVGWIILGIIAAVTAGVAIFDATTKSVEELQEELDDLKSEISDMKSELESLNSELETTQDRMEELLSKDSLSFTEEEELKNLQLQNELLEKKIKLQEMLLKNKTKEANKTSEDLIDASWNGTKVDKKYAILFGNGTIGEDDFFTKGVSGKEALNQYIPQYAALLKQNEELKNLYISAQKELNDSDQLSYETFKSIVNAIPSLGEGSESYYNQSFRFSDKDIVDMFKSEVLDSNETTIDRMEAGIEMVLGDLLEQIPEDYEYGTSDIIDQAFDELTAYQLKYENAQGTTGKSEIINTIFGTGASEELQSLEKELQEIASSEDDVAKKTQKAQDLIQKAYESTDDGYKRLKNSIDIVDISVEELAKSFIATSEAADLGTIGGVLRVFSGGEEILKDFKNGVTETWDGLFKEVDGNKVADNLKVADILKGADEDIRNQFTKLIEAIEDEKMGVDEALSKWRMAGIDKAVEALNTEFESLNNEMFPDAADEISGLIDTLSELKSAFESVASTMDTFESAQEEYSNTGRVSIQTALELMSATDDWDKILNITEDSITLVDGAEKALMETQLESIAEQTQAAADLAKSKWEAAVQAQNAKAAFDAEAGAVNDLNTAEQNVSTTQQNATLTTQQRTGAMGDLAVQTYGTAISELDYADNDDTVQTAEGVKAKAIGLVSAAIVGLDSFIDALLTDKTMSEAWAEYQEARNVVINDANSKTTTVDALRKDYEKKQQMAILAKNGDSYSEFSGNYNGEKDDSGDEDDAFQEAMDYWENRIAANQARYEQVQNEIDLLEAKGQKAGAQYYQEQIKLENERLSLLEQQKAEAQSFLGTFAEGSEEWFRKKPA